MIQAALIGAGSRGMHAYASYALKNPHEIKFIAVAEGNAERREKFAKGSWNSKRNAIFDLGRFTRSAEIM